MSVPCSESFRLSPSWVPYPIVLLLHIVGITRLCRGFGSVFLIMYSAANNIHPSLAPWPVDLHGNDIYYVDHGFSRTDSGRPDGEDHTPYQYILHAIDTNRKVTTNR